MHHNFGGKAWIMGSKELVDSGRIADFLGASSSQAKEHFRQAGGTGFWDLAPNQAFLCREILIVVKVAPVYAGKEKVP